MKNYDKEEELNHSRKPSTTLRVERGVRQSKIAVVPDERARTLVIPE